MAENLTEIDRLLASIEYGDLTWLDDAACADLAPSDFFVEAGHVIDDAVLNTCRACPVRRDCVVHAYRRRIIGGYFGGLSPGQRRGMTLRQALTHIAKDPPRSRGSRTRG